ncbi:MAG: hypothetical protein IJ058_07935 [Lachnospiraceae bacterium]|nr:hypothetical protein [Lachnospiraceae bacterium]
MRIIAQEEREEGREEGRAEGRKEGRAEGLRESIGNMLRRGKTVDEIVDFCDYPREFVEEIREREGIS